VRKREKGGNEKKKNKKILLRFLITALKSAEKNVLQFALITAGLSPNERER